MDSVEENVQWSSVNKIEYIFEKHEALMLIAPDWGTTALGGTQQHGNSALCLTQWRWHVSIVKGGCFILKGWKE